MIRYSVFISSAYKSLKKERAKVIDAVLKIGDCFPLAMEHFTAANFEEIEKLIDISDAVILMLGDEYGTKSDDGMSLTMKEYEYANGKGKHIFVIDVRKETEETDVKQKSSSDYKKQKKFIKQVEKDKFLCRITRNNEYFEKINSHFNTIRSSNGFTGWERRTDEKKWQQDHPGFYLGGEWFSFHISNSDDTYLKIGKVVIDQHFNSRDFKELDVRGENYKCYYEPNTGKIEERMDICTDWKADYELYLDNEGKIIKEILGIFTADRNYEDSFADIIIKEGSKDGIHKFKTELSDKGRITSIFGKFSNIADKKAGTIALFRDKKARDEYLISHYSDRLNNNKKQV